MGFIKRRTFKIGALVVAVCGAIAVGIWWYTGPRLVYTSEGYGGYVPAGQMRHRKSSNVLGPAVDAYNKGKFKEAEAAAWRVIDSARGSKNIKERKTAVKARYIVAFAAARRKNLSLARDRFATLKTEAAKLPDKGAQAPLPGVQQPTLEEDAAYQHAVCTAALGDKKAAEAEYMKIIRDYPESPVVTQAARRIEMLHDGHMPPEAEAAWQNASRIAQVRQDARRKAEMKEQSMCGPECLAELLRRKGEKPDVEALAREMKTGPNGTSLLNLCNVANKHGVSCKGVKLTAKGLEKQRLPIIVLIGGGHYVILEGLGRKSVTTWDPNGEGVRKPSRRILPMQEWTRTWEGIALVPIAQQFGCRAQVWSKSVALPGNRAAVRGSRTPHVGGP